MQLLLLALVIVGYFFMQPVYLPVLATLSWSCLAMYQLRVASAGCKMRSVSLVQACPVAAMYCQLMGLYSDWQ